jgi:hypothetical protein
MVVVVAVLRVYVKMNFNYMAKGEDLLVRRVSVLTGSNSAGSTFHVNARHIELSVNADEFVCR